MHWGPKRVPGKNWWASLWGHLPSYLSELLWLLLVVLWLEERGIFVLNEKIASTWWCAHFQLAVSIQVNVWDCQIPSWGMGQNAVIAKRPVVVPQDMVFCPRKNLLRQCCPAPNHSRVEGERMLTHFFLGHLRYSGRLDTVYRLKLRGSQGTFLLPSPHLPFPRWTVLFFSMTLKLSSFQVLAGCISGLERTQIIHLMERRVFSTRSKTS